MSVRSKPNREGEAPAEPAFDVSDQPEGWTAAALGQITRDISYGYTAKAIDTDVGPKLLRITDIQDSGVNWDTVPFCEIDEHRVDSYRLSPGDLVFARTGATTGKSFLIKTCPDSVFASYLIRVRPSDALLPEYVAAFFQTRDYWNQITENLSGSAQPNCNASKLASLVVPIAPLAEQRRIVGKLELLLGKVSSSQQRLSRVPGLLKRFRQSVLAAACSGKLTADWREENAGVEHSATLLDRIDKQRATASRGVKSGKAVETAGEAVVRLSDEDSPADIIPDTWSWVRFGSVIGGLRNGVSIRPNVDPPGTPILRISAARPGCVDLSDFRFMPDASQFIPLYTLKDGDLLFTRYNGSLELLGVCGMVRNIGTQTVLYPDKLMRVRFDHDFIVPSYAELFFQVADVHERIIAKSKSSAGQNGVSGSDIKNQPFAIPPLSEQQEIVRRVEKLFAFADQIEARLRQAQAHVDRLTQSLLAKAFRGELVPTEHTLATNEGREYESATKLLGRIRASANEEISGNRKRKVTSKGT